MHTIASDKNSMIFECIKENNLSSLKSLIEADVSNLQNIHLLYSYLHSAASNGNIEAVQFFLNKGLNINIKDHDKRNILFSAIEHGKLEMVEFLIKSNINTSVKDNYDLSPLNFAKIMQSTNSKNKKLHHISNKIVSILENHEKLKANQR